MRRPLYEFVDRIPLAESGKHQYVIRKFPAKAAELGRGSLTDDRVPHALRGDVIGHMLILTPRASNLTP